MSDIHARALLARNLWALIREDTPQDEKPSVRAWALGKGLDVKLIERLVKNQHAVTLDKLQEIAEAVGLKPWHLLLEEFDPSSEPDSPITEDERKMLTRLRKLLDK